VSDGFEEAPVTARVPERPSVHLGRIRKLRPRELVIRFVIGALVSLVSGLVGLAFGMRAGGIFLASPAILAASLTLIEAQEDSPEAREDARGALAGGAAMGAFAAVAALTLGHMGLVAALLLASASWLAVALGLYAAAWFR
jgi:hypothetical protein